MAKKSMMTKATDAVKEVAGTALGAAAAAATTVVVATVAEAIAKGGKRLDKAGPSLKKSAAEVVSKPLMPAPKRKSRPATQRNAVLKKAAPKASGAKKKKAKQAASKKK
jgi:hypothetical protein